MFKQARQNWRSMQKYLKITLDELMGHIRQIVKTTLYQMIWRNYVHYENIYDKFFEPVKSIFGFYCGPKYTYPIPSSRSLTPPCHYISGDWLGKKKCRLYQGALWTRLLQDLVIWVVNHRGHLYHQAKKLCVWRQWKQYYTFIFSGGFQTFKN